MDMLLEEIPREYHRVFEEITEIIEDFCKKHLNEEEEYERLCIELTYILCRDSAPLNRGNPAGWAAGIVHTIGWVNFLHDPDTRPYMTSEELAKGFGISKGTMMNKSRIIRNGMDIMQMDPSWCLTSMLEHNPLVWLVMIDGIMMDMRHAPRNLQKKAYRQGLIPYIPEPKEKPKPQTKTPQQPKILKFPDQSIKPEAVEPAPDPNQKEPDLFD